MLRKSKFDIVWVEHGAERWRWPDRAAHFYNSRLANDVDLTLRFATKHHDGSPEEGSAEY